MGGLADAYVAIQQRTAVIRTKQPLVRVDDEAVDQLDASELMSHTSRAQSRSPVGAIDVKPHRVLLSKETYAMQVVDDAKVGSASRRHHGAHSRAVFMRHCGEDTTHRRRRQSIGSVGWHSDEVGVHRVCGECDRGMSTTRSQNDGTHSIMGSPAALPPLPPCSDERREIAGGSATDKDAARGCRKLSEVCEPRQRLVLGVDRAGAFEPRTGIHVAGSNDKIKQH